MNLKQSQPRGKHKSLGQESFEGENGTRDLRCREDQRQASGPMSVSQAVGWGRRGRRAQGCQHGRGISPRGSFQQNEHPWM